MKSTFCSVLLIDIRFFESSTDPRVKCTLDFSSRSFTLYLKKIFEILFFTYHDALKRGNTLSEIFFRRKRAVDKTIPIFIEELISTPVL